MSDRSAGNRSQGDKLWAEALARMGFDPDHEVCSGFLGQLATADLARSLVSPYSDLHRVRLTSSVHEGWENIEFAVTSLVQDFRGGGDYQVGELYTPDWRVEGYVVSDPIALHPPDWMDPEDYFPDRIRLYLELGIENTIQLVYAQRLPGR